MYDVSRRDFIRGLLFTGLAAGLTLPVGVREAFAEERTEHHLKTLIDHTPVNYAVVGEDGSFQYGNTTWKRWLTVLRPAINETYGERCSLFYELDIPGGKTIGAHQLLRVAKADHAAKTLI